MATWQHHWNGDSCPIFFPGVQRGWGRESWQMAMSQVWDGVTVYLICIYIYIYFCCNPCNEQTEQSGFWHRTSKLICLRLENQKTICQVDSPTPKFLKHSQKNIQNCLWNQAFQQANYLASNAKYSQASKGCRFCGVQQHDQRLFSPKMKWLENWLLHLFLMEKSSVDWAGIHWKIGAGLE